MNREKKELAILGGKPVRKAPFLSSVVIDEDDKNNILEVIKSKEFSRFMGSSSEDIHKLLEMSSVEASDYKSQYFTFLGGRMVRRFEAEFSKRFDVPYAISVNSATSGLSAALGAAGIGPGDEVITTCLSFNATATSILLFNSIPVFVDISDYNFCLDPALVKMAITDKTKAILVVHLLGYAADMDQITDIAREHNLIFIEDCAQAPGVIYKGRPVGTIGDLGVFSFQESKNIMTGEGGMVITSNPEYAKRIRLIRNHGESIPDNSWTKGQLINLIGMNYRMTELTAALGISQLKKLYKNNHCRKENAEYLCKNLTELEGLKVPEFPKGTIPHIVPFLYDESITGIRREKILIALKAEGIHVGSGYTRLMSQNPLFTKKIAYGNQGCPWSCHLHNKEHNKEVSYKDEQFPVADDLVKSKFIWFYHINPPNTLSDMDDVIEAFRKVFNNLEALRGYKLEKTKIGYKW